MRAKVRARGFLVAFLVALGLVVPIGPPAQALGASLSATASPIWQTNNSVWAIASAQGRVFVGGQFTRVRPPGAAAGTQETARTYLAEFDATTGALITSFNPVLNGAVWSLATSPDGSRLFVGGDFTNINGSTRTRLAAFNVATGALDTQFRPSASARVKAMSVRGTTLYAGGAFGLMNNATRHRAGAVSTTDGSLLAWNPDVDADVIAVTAALDGSKVYLGGRFANVGGVPNYAMAATNPASGAPLSFPGQSAVPPPTPGCVSGVRNIVVDDNTVYAAAAGDGGGCFDGTFAADIGTGALKWKNNCLGATEAIAVVKGWLYKGAHAHDCSMEGAFPQGNPRHLLVENLSDGKIGSWYPNTNSGGSTSVGPLAMGTDGDQLFVGGDFTTVNGVGQQGLTRFRSTPDTSPTRPLTPSAVSATRGTVKVNFTAALDNDDETLSYTLYRNTSALPLKTYSLVSRFWDIPSISYVDSGLAPGTQVAYRVEVTDGTTVVTSFWTPYVTVAATNASYPTVIASDAPSNYWRLGEGNGTTAADIGTRPSPGTYSSVTLGQSGAIAGSTNTAALFNGASSQVSTATQYPGPQTFSIEAWIKTSTTSGGKILGFGNSQTGTSGNYDRHLYMTNDGHVMLGVYNNAVYTVRSQGALNDGGWHHLVGTFSPGALMLYVDGRVQGTTASAAAQGYSGWWKIGADNLNGWPDQPSSNAFAGTIDEVAVYPAALTATDIATHFTAAGGNLKPTPSYSVTCTLLDCSFDASESSDDGAVISYAWDFGDGGTSAGVTATHTYDEPGKYDVTLTVTDDKGAASTLTKVATATPPPPADNYGKTVAADTPDIYWRLGESSGAVAADSGVTSNHGTYFGAVTLGAQGAVNGTSDTAASFDGSDDGVGASNAVDDPKTYSMEAWFKTTTTSGGKIIGFGNERSGFSSNYDRHVYMEDSGQVVFGVWTGFTNTITSSSPYNDNAWHHVVATQSTVDGMKLYLDGQLVGTNGQTDSQPYTGYWRVGGDSSWGGSSAYFDGLIDEVAVYSKALTAARVQAHYDVGVASPGPAPVAVADSVSTAYQTAKTVPAPGLLGNDTGSGLTVLSSTQPAHGSVVVGANGNFTYTPDPAYAGDDSFTYTVSDPLDRTSTATVSVAVLPPPAPTAADDSSSTTFGTGRTVPAPGVLANDSGTGISVTGSTQPAHGTVSLSADGGFTYTPENGYAGLDSFDYTITDALGRSASATVSVTIGAAPSLVLAQDSFGRTNSAGWGTADVGGAWTTSNNASFAVNGARGTVNLAAGNVRTVFLSGLGAVRDVDATSNVQIDKMPGGSGSYSSLSLRRTSLSSVTEYRGTLRVQANGRVTGLIYRLNGSDPAVVIGPETTITGVTASPGQPLSMRFAAVGANPTQLSLTIWRTDLAEPAAQVTASDSAPSLQSAGLVGATATLSGSSAVGTVQVGFDDFVARKPS